VTKKQLTMPEENRQDHTSPLSGRWIVLIVAATLGVRIALMIILQSWDFRNEWAYGYEMGLMGKWLAEGKGFISPGDGQSPTALFPPFYPLVVAGFFYVFGIYSKAAAVGLFLFQSACSAGAAVCLAVLGNRLLGRTAGLIAGFVWAFYPTSLFFSVVHIWYSELSVMLVLIAMTIAVNAEQSPSMGRVAFLGGLSGLIVLVDSAMVLYVLFLLLWMLFAWRVKLPRFVVLVVVWGITAGVAVSPWAARNWVVLGSPRVLKSNLGAAFFTGNNPFSSGANDRTEIKQAFAAHEGKALNKSRGGSELAYQGHLQKKGLEWIWANPFSFLQLTAQRIWYFWVWIPRLGWKSLVHLAYFGPFAVLALCGLWHGLRRKWHLAPVWLFLLVYPLPYYVTFVSRGRYRHPVEPLIVLLAAIPLAVWFESRSHTTARGSPKTGNSDITLETCDQLPLAR